MTADLFIKLSAKIYAKRKYDPIFQPLTASALEKLEITCTGPDPVVVPKPYSMSSWSSFTNPEDYGGPGGALLYPPETTDGVPPDKLAMGNILPAKSLPIKSLPVKSLPADWHAAQLNPKGTGYRSLGSGIGPAIEQWIPAMGSRFWDVYGNMLRVNSIEGGVCPLSLIDED